ncbi:mitochondrial carrier domain-containing protein [Cladochytrium replicatum]|nr:mitochondrial carrier domain-containing protein [Cladochytrium replicatum]
MATDLAAVTPADFDRAVHDSPSPTPNSQSPEPPLGQSISSHIPHVDAPPSRSWYHSIISNEQMRQTIAGGGAGCVAAVATCPLDVVKIRLQNQSRSVPPPEYTETPSTSQTHQKRGGVSSLWTRKPPEPSHRPASASAAPATVATKHPFYTGTFSALNKIYKADGIRGLYRGVGPTVAGYLPTWAIYFTVYDSAKETLASFSDRSENDTLVHVFSAMMAGAASSAGTNPIWIVRTRIMLQPKHPTADTPYYYRSTWDGLRTIVRREGVKTLYTGMGLSLLGVTHVAIQFPLYEKLKVEIADTFPTEHPGEVGSFGIIVASATSKMAASLATYPHEVVRTRLQSQTYIGKEDAGGGERRYRGLVHTIRKVYADEGFHGFYKGLPTNLLRTVPASALTLLTYEMLVRRLEILSRGGR